jgi:hypothetical protein
MALVTRVVCNKMGEGSKGNGDKGGGQARATRAMEMATTTMWGMAMAMRQAGDKEDKGEGGKGNSNGDEGGR